MIKHNFKRFAAMFLTLAMVFSVCSSSAFAENSTSSPVTDTPITNSTIGPLIASGASGFSGGSGSFNVYLDSGNFYADIMAGTATTGATGLVTCYVHCPDGNDYLLGSVPASGGATLTT